MGIERIDSIYDIPALQAEHDKYINFLKQSKQAIVDLNNLRVTSKGSDLSTFTKATTELNQAINASTSYTNAAIISKKELTRAEIEARLANQQRTAAIKNEIIETRAQIGSYDQLQAQLKRLQAEYKGLGQAARQGAQGADIQKSILNTKNQLKSLDAGIGDHQRNVGNYVKSIGAGFETAATRVLNYALAYAGFNAVIGLFQSSIGEALEAEKAAIRFKATLDSIGRVDAFERLSKKAVDMANQFKYLDNDEIVGVFEKLVTYGKLSENQINDLTPVIINYAAKSGKSLSEASETIIGALEGQGRALKTLGINVKDAKTDAERLGIVMTELKGKVEGAADAFGETTSGKLAVTQQNFKNLKEEIGNGLLPVLNKLLEGVNGLLNGFKKMADDGIEKVVKNTFKGMTIYMLEGYGALQKYQKLRDDINKGLKTEDGKEIAQLVQPPDTIVGGDKKFGTADSKAGVEKKKEARKDNLQSLKETVNNEFQIYKVLQDQKIRLLDADIENDKNAYDKKLQILEDYTRASNNLLLEEEKDKIDIAKRTAAREINSLKESLEGKSANEKARINENIKITQENLEEDILLIQTTYQDKQLQLIEDTAKRREEILKEQKDKEVKLYEDIMKGFEDAEKKHTEQLKDEAREREEFAKKQRDIELEAEEELQEKKNELAQQGADFLFSLGSAGYERRLNQIQSERDEVDKQKENELRANDALVQSAEQKAANIEIINSRAAAKNEALDRKEREVQYRRAQFERGQQIFEIGIATIKAIFAIKAKALATAPAGLAFLSQIPLVIASSALSIAAILAKPLPKYKGGRGTGIEELAITGDGGVPEYIHRADGTIEKTPAVETLTHLMPKDKVYPNKQALMRELAMSAMLSNYVVNKGGGIDKDDMRSFTSEIVNAVGDIKIHTQMITKDGWREHNQRLAQYDKWVQQYIKN